MIPRMPPMERNPPRRNMVIPDGTKELRACVKCHLVKTRRQFVEDGCNNCTLFDPETSKHERENIIDKYTTSSFEGIVAMVTPGKGWVTRWQGIPAKFQPGTYALSVRGKIQDDDI